MNSPPREKYKKSAAAPVGQSHRHNFQREMLPSENRRERRMLPVNPSRKETPALPDCGPLQIERSDSESDSYGRITHN
jgi:hypothetical protein